MIIVPSLSPNYNARNFPTARGASRINMIILHYTDVPTADEARSLMQDPAHKAAAHYLVDTNGAIEQLISDEHRAWHAGESYWAGEEDINSVSLGIEIQNPGHRGGNKAYPLAQIKSVTALCRHLIAKHDLDKEAVLAHSDVAPARKIDPGEWFPWADLAAHEVGYWPTVCMADKMHATEMAEEELIELLTMCGYDMRQDLDVVIAAFQRHFVPEIFLDPDSVGKADVLTRAKLIHCAAHAQSRGGALGMKRALTRA